MRAGHGREHDSPGAGPQLIRHAVYFSTLGSPNARDGANRTIRRDGVEMFVSEAGSCTGGPPQEARPLIDRRRYVETLDC